MDTQTPTQATSQASSLTRDHPPYPTSTSVPTVETPATILAVFSLVFGILSFYPFVVIGSIVAFVTGYLAQRELRRNGLTTSGSYRMATHGLLMAGVSVIAWMLLVCAVGMIQFSTQGT